METKKIGKKKIEKKKIEKEKKERKKSKKAKGLTSMKKEAEYRSRLGDKSRRNKSTRKKKYKKDKHKRKKLRKLRKILKEKEKETKQHIKEVEKELKQNLAIGQYNIDIIKLKLIAHLNLPTDILSKLIQKIEETEKIEINIKKEEINIKLKNIRTIINQINNMSYPDLFKDYLSPDTQNTFENLEAFTQEIEEQKKSMTQTSKRDDIIKKNLNLIQILFDELYKITNDLLLDEHDFYYELEYLSELLENIDNLTNPEQMQVQIRIDS